MLREVIGAPAFGGRWPRVVRCRKAESDDSVPLSGQVFHQLVAYPRHEPQFVKHVRSRPMGILTALFGSKRSSRKTTSEDPLRLKNPTIGFLNLMEDSGQALLESDAKTLAPLFRRTLRSVSTAPVCEVLFLYCELDPDGHIKGRAETVSDLIKSARAYIVVIASENST